MVDRGSGFDQAKFERDLAECRSQAAAYDPTGKIVENMLLSTVIGTVAGVAGGAIGGDPGLGAAVGAGAGAAGGVTMSIADIPATRNRIVANCLSGRGHRVLNPPPQF